ncbi:UNVERIFIED_CONTAM: hypothetical protein Sindi_1837700, partial [Sesamum indicum]
AAPDTLASSGVCGAGVVMSGGVGHRRTASPTWEASDETGRSGGPRPCPRPRPRGIGGVPLNMI